MQRRDEFDGSVNASTTVNIMTSVPGSNHSFPKLVRTSCIWDNCITTYVATYA